MIHINFYLFWDISETDTPYLYLINTYLEAFAHGEEVVEFLLWQVDAPFVDEIQDVVEAPSRDAAKIEHHRHHLGVGVEPRLLLEEGPEKDI